MPGMTRGLRRDIAARIGRRVDSFAHDATASVRVVLRLTPRLLRLHQQQQHSLQRQIVARLLIAQARYATEHVKLVSRVLAFGIHRVIMDLIAGVVCQA
jgi:hypothetical protein